MRYWMLPVSMTVLDDGIGRYRYRMTVFSRDGEMDLQLPVRRSLVRPPNRPKKHRGGRPPLSGAAAAEDKKRTKTCTNETLKGREARDPNRGIRGGFIL